MEYLAHKEDTGTRVHRVKEHLCETAQLAAQLAAQFGAEEQAFFAGMLHDIGKYSEKFQERIRGAAVQVDHSTAGAKCAAEHQNSLAALCIAGHHGGMPNLGTGSDTAADATLRGRLRREVGRELEDYSAFMQEITIPSAKDFPAFVTDRYNAFFLHICSIPRWLTRIG